jgi:glyoxylase-like metal-dependent hydrolase (beta-lactamase superfamily II)
MAPRPPLLRVGDIDIWAVMDGRLTVAEPPGFPHKDSPEFAVNADYIVDGQWLIDIGGFVVRAGDRLVLIDAGAGQGNGELFTPRSFTGLDDADPALIDYAAGMGLTEPDDVMQLLAGVMNTDVRTGSFGANLAALGFAPEDFTDVLISHLHFDHIGWVSKDGLPYFPNAVVRCEHHDAEYFLAPGFDDRFYQVMWNAMATADRMAPIMGQFETWHEDVTIAPGIECRFAPGHTPGSSIFAITSGSQQALILGDSVHCPHELIDPDFALPIDLDADLGNRSREMIREAACHDDTLVSAPHFSGLRFGRLVAGDRPRQYHFSWVTPAASA